MVWDMSRSAKTSWIEMDLRKETVEEALVEVCEDLVD